MADILHTGCRDLECAIRSSNKNKSSNKQSDPRSNLAKSFVAKSFHANNKRRLEWRIKGKIVDTERVEQNINGRSVKAETMRS